LFLAGPDAACGPSRTSSRRYHPTWMSRTTRRGKRSSRVGCWQIIRVNHGRCWEMGLCLRSGVAPTAGRPSTPDVTGASNTTRFRVAFRHHQEAINGFATRGDLTGWETSRMKCPSYRTGPWLPVPDAE
jgi:hypothetical protein